MSAPPAVSNPLPATQSVMVRMTVVAMTAPCSAHPARRCPAALPREPGNPCDVLESAAEDAADNRRDGQYAESFSTVVAEIR